MYKYHIVFKRLLIISLILPFNLSSAISAEYGTYLHFFAADSFWNSKPISPVFLDYTIPNSLYIPTAYTPAYSASCYFSDATNPPVTIKVGPGYGGIHDRDAERLVSTITIPHWPADVIPASGGDAHADVIDVDNKIIHSFYKLKNVNGEWTSGLYAWSSLDGRGWGDPAHFYQGGRATGVPACAGMIRVHEVNDGELMFQHALAISLTDNALAQNYVFPSTSTDVNVSNYSGQIPEGALLMLPPDFKVSRLTIPLLKKIAYTLQTYGAYVVDRNYGTPYVIYSEIGAQTNIVTTSGNGFYELTLIQKSLRMVTSVQGWVDGNGNSFQANQNLNVLSFRGPWARGYSYQADSDICNDNCGQLGKFDSIQQAVVFDTTDEEIVQSNPSGRSVTHVYWAKPKKGYKYQLTAATTGGGKLRFVIRDPEKNDYVSYDSKALVDGQSVTFTWPLDNYDTTTIAISGVGEPSTVSGSLVRIE
jgi:hypothetical protein